MSADLRSEAAACQWICWEHPAVIPNFSAIAPSKTRSFPLPLSDPSTPSVISERKQSTGGCELVNLRPEWCCLRSGSEVIINHNPTIVGQQIAVAVQVSAHVAVRIKDKQAYFTTT